MRAAAALAIFIAILPAIVAAQVVESKDHAGPSDKEVFDMLGSPMSQVIAKFGFPSQLDVTDRKSKEPKARLEYGNFGFSVFEKQVRECIEWYPLAGDAVLGIKVGDATDDIEKKLGKPKTKITNAGGGGIILWDDPDHNRVVEVVFSKQNKCIGLAVIKN